MILIVCNVCNSHNFIAVFGVYVTSLTIKSVGIPDFLKDFSNCHHSAGEDKKKQKTHPKVSEPGRKKNLKIFKYSTENLVVS